MLVIGRQLCVITFDTRSLWLVWEVRSLVWFIVLRFTAFCTHAGECKQAHNEEEKKKRREQ